MSHQRIFRGRTAILGCLVLLLIGTYSQTVASAEGGILDLVEFSSFLGGSGDEHMEVSYAFGSTVVDSKGNIIVVGRTTSTDFPLKNAYQDAYHGGSDATISKFRPNGSLMFSTYFGGVGQETPTEVVVDSEDNIIIAGVTGSPDLPLVNAYKSNSTGITEGSVDTFIAKFSEDGQTLLFSTFFGGSGNDWCYTLALDSGGRMAISGTTDSSDYPLLNAHQISNSGGLDVFLALLDADGQSLLFSTYLGTSTIDHGRRVAFDSQGRILLVGMTGNGDLATEGAFQETYGGGGSDAFLAEFDTSGTLEYLTYIGGASNEWGCDLALDSEDNAVITGFTSSDDFPTLNAIRDEGSTYPDMFITKATADGSSVVFSTYMGGSSSDYGNAIAVDPQDRIILAGQTKSVDFPTDPPYNTTESYFDDASLVVLSSSGSLLLSMVFGGAHNDNGISITWHSDDKYIVLGYTESDDFPVSQAYQESYGGSSDMFIMSLDLQGLVDIPQNGLPFVVVASGIAAGGVIVVAVLVFIRRR
ncbi:hypothetical protein EU545_02520 [Candidatus Thorarchaeota archaeon]|nr:MAG: hypothetical protein EU545_02520 [Candidatus Thorarchaeota archaeon]